MPHAHSQIQSRLEVYLKFSNATPLTADDYMAMNKLVAKQYRTFEKAYLSFSRYDQHADKNLSKNFLLQYLDKLNKHELVALKKELKYSNKNLYAEVEKLYPSKFHKILSKFNLFAFKQINNMAVRKESDMINKKKSFIKCFAHRPNLMMCFFFLSFDDVLINLPLSMFIYNTPSIIYIN